jgi:hypothetical protein
MFGPKEENKIYAQSFRRSQEGHAIWPKAYSNYLQPGSCGYVDGYGNFVKISQLTDADAIEELKLGSSDGTKELKLGSLDGIKVEDDGGNTFWDAKTSSKVAGAAVTLDAEAA